MNQQFQFELKPDKFIKTVRYILYALLFLTFAKILISPYDFVISSANYIWILNLLCFYALYTDIKIIKFQITEDGFISAKEFMNKTCSAVPLKEIQAIKLYKNYNYKAVGRKINAYVLLNKNNQILSYLSTKLYSKDDALKLVEYLKAKNHSIDVNIDTAETNFTNQEPKILLSIKGRTAIYKFLGGIEIMICFIVLAAMFISDISQITSDSVSIVGYLMEHTLKIQLYILLCFAMGIFHWIFKLAKSGAIVNVYDDGLVVMRMAGAAVTFFNLEQIKKIRHSYVRAVSGVGPNMRIKVSYIQFLDSNENLLANIGALLLSSKEQSDLFNLIQQRSKNIVFEGF